MTNTKQIIVSSNLKNILKEIESESVVARLLLMCEVPEDMIIENPVNYISMAHDKTKISYLTVDRMSKMDESEYWETSRRFSARPGAFVTKVFKNISSRDIEIFSNLYNSCISSGNLTFKVVSGEDIQKYYHYSKYISVDEGTLGASCMKHDHCRNFFGIYCNNPIIVKMLVAINEDCKLIGRALLWEFDGNKIMDRIYSICDEEYRFKFKKWATENGYLYKSEQNWYNTLNFENLNTEKREIKFNIKLDSYIFDRYPYLDTFKFIDFNTGVISNYIPESNHKVLSSAEGNIHDRDYLRFDEIDRILRYSGDCAYVRYLDIYTSFQNVNFSNINEDHILCKDSVYNSELGDYLFNEEYNRFNNIERINARKEYIKQRKEEREKRFRKNQAVEQNLHDTLSASQVVEMILNINPNIENTYLDGRNEVTEYYRRIMIDGDYVEYTISQPTEE